MPVSVRMLLLAALVVLAACDGPKENAGENADAANGVATSDPLTRGPAERLGQAQDRSDSANAAAVESVADRDEATADVVRAEADERADALEQQARDMRAEAERRADALDDRAEATRR